METGIHRLKYIPFLFASNFCRYVLVLSGIESIFFRIACMVLCFGSGVNENRVDKHTDALVLAEQFLHSIKTLSVSHAALPKSRLAVHKNLEGDTAGTADPN